MEELKKILIAWAVIGYFLALTLPPIDKNNKCQALKQCIIAGPIYWVCVPIIGLFMRIKQGLKQE